MEMIYKTTTKGSLYFAFLGDPRRQTASQWLDSESRRAAMTTFDWALEQLLVILDEGQSRDDLIEAFTYSRDSLVEQSFPTTDPERTAESIKTFQFALDNLDNLLQHAIDNHLVMGQLPINVNWITE